ncbi:cytochrome c oxidase subunit II [Bacteriovoracaceae bacterium]|nr:cytochrome c oxidase subunit II [Bacteriovoracaceae bacterium]
MLDWLLGLTPENISSYGADIDGVISTTTQIVFYWWLVAEILLIAFIIMYRKRPGQKAAYITGASWKAMSYVLIPTFFVLLLDIYLDIKSQRVWDHVKTNLPKADIEAKVVGMQFSWLYTLPGKDNKLGTDDDIETDVLTFPVDKVIHVHISSTDVLHSFFLPHMRFKQDAVPGRTITGWFKATKTGVYPVSCAELCGTGHGIMASSYEVMTQEDYDQWVIENSEDEEVASNDVSAEPASAGFIEEDYPETKIDPKYKEGGEDHTTFSRSAPERNTELDGDASEENSSNEEDTEDIQ